MMGIHLVQDKKGLWNVLVHERLSIQDTSLHGKQPFVYDHEGFMLCSNGEIYNVD